MSIEFNKAEYSELRRIANENDIFTYSTNYSYLGREYNGISVAFTRAIANGRMLLVSVSYCALEDVFGSNVGRFQALHKLINLEEYVQIPLGDLLDTAGVAETAKRLTRMFDI